MMNDSSYYDRRQSLEASFDGTIPSARLDEPQSASKPADAYQLLRQIAERRRSLQAEQAQTDETLARLTRHLSWLVTHDRQKQAVAGSD